MVIFIQKYTYTMLQKVLYIILVSVFLFGNVQAQGGQTGKIFNFEDKRFFASIHVGGNFSQVDGDTYGGYHKLGLVAGPSVLVQMNKNWVLQVGLQYSQKGSRNGSARGSDLGSYIEKYKLNLHTADLPIMLNYVHNEMFLFGAGLAYSAYFSSTEEIHSYNGVRVFDAQEFKFNRHSAEAIFNAAAMANKNLMFYIRYQYSITPIRNYQFNATGLRNQVNNYFTIGMAYLF